MRMGIDKKERDAVLICAHPCDPWFIDLSGIACTAETAVSRTDLDRGLWFIFGRSG